MQGSLLRPWVLGGSLTHSCLVPLLAGSLPEDSLSHWTLEPLLFLVSLLADSLADGSLSHWTLGFPSFLISLLADSLAEGSLSHWTPDFPKLHSTQALFRACVRLEELMHRQHQRSPSSPQADSLLGAVVEA